MILGTTSIKLYHLTLTSVYFSLTSPLGNHDRILPSLLPLLQMYSSVEDVFISSFLLLLVFFLFLFFWHRNFIFKVHKAVGFVVSIIKWKTENIIK